MKKIATLVLGMVVSQLSASAIDKSTFAQKPSPLGFEENRGQVIDQYGAPRPDIHYKLASSGMSVFVGSGQLHYQFYRYEKNVLPLKRALPMSQDKEFEAPPIVHTYRVDVTLEGANQHARVITENVVDGYNNYYTGNCGESGAKTNSYRKVTYKDIYPGIDWVLYVKGNSMEYDFVVHPAGNVADIVMKYNGASDLALSENGNINATTVYGNISENAPYAYQQQDKKEVYTRFRLQDNTVTFAAASYTGTLVIDPVIEWATYFGGESSNNITSIKTSNSGFVYFTGRTGSATNIATTGAFQQTLQGSHTNTIIAKFDKAGNRIWSTYYGGGTTYSQVIMMQGYNEGTSIDIDNKHGYLYVAGATNAITNIATPGAYQDALKLSVTGAPLFGVNLSIDAFLAKFDTLGNRIWGTYYGDDSTDEGFILGEINVAYDEKNDKVNLATATSKTGRATAGAAQEIMGGYQASQEMGDGLLTQFNSNGTRQWATYFGADSAEVIMAIAVDKDANIYISGYTMSPDGIATNGAHQTVMSPGNQQNGVAFLAKFNSGGVRQWSTYYGDYGEWGQSVACNKYGQVYLAGISTTRQLAANPVIATAGAWQVYNGGVNGITPNNQDAYLVRFTGEGTRVWGTYYGGEDADFGYGVSCDQAGNAYLTGTTGTKSSTFLGRIATPGSYQDTLAGETEPGNFSNDAFLAQFDSSGNRIWGTYFGGMETEEARKGILRHMSVTNDKENSLYLAGATYSTTGIATPGSYQDTFAYGAANPPMFTYLVNGFIAKFIQLDYSVTLAGLLDTACAGSRELAVEFRNNGMASSPLLSNFTTITYMYVNHRTGLGDTLTNSPSGLLPMTSAGLHLGNAVLDTGTYTFSTYITRVTNDGSVANDTMTMQVYLKDCTTNSVNGIAGGNGIKIYPNPAQQVLYAVLPEDMAGQQVQIYNAIGSMLQQQTATAGNNRIDISSLVPGYYMLRIATEDGYHNQSFQVLK